jgi:hypothetical protein
MNPPPLRATGDRVLVRRVHWRTGLIHHVRETLGVDDAVLKLGEVVSVGPRFKTTFADRELEMGDLIIYPSPRVYDHFKWGSSDVLVVPGAWICAVVTDTFLADHPEAREYGDELV